MDVDLNMANIPRPVFRSYKNIGRHWIKRPRPLHIERNHHHNFEFTIASYNILADQLLHQHSYLYGYQNHEPYIYDWNYRKHNLLHEILYANPDILCLQEVQEEHFYDWFNPRLKDNGYTGVYKKRSGDKPDGCATFFKDDLFSLEQYHLIDFHSNKVPFMDRNNVAILTLLKPRTKKLKKPTPLCISNTHLLFNTKRGDIKLTQLGHLFAEINRLAKTQQNSKTTFIPTILCGDFNSVPFSPIYHFIVKGELKYKGLFKSEISGQLPYPSGSIFGDDLFPPSIGLSNGCHWQNQDSEDIEGKRFVPPGIIKHNMKIESSYKHIDINGCREVTTCHERGSMTVDYIFYTSNGEEEDINNISNNENKLWLSGVLRLLTDHELSNFGKLPNKMLSSDHLLLMSSFILS